MTDGFNNQIIGVMVFEKQKNSKGIENNIRSDGVKEEFVESAWILASEEIGAQNGGKKPETGEKINQAFLYLILAKVKAKN